MKLYTKTGDQGNTSLLGGKKVLKSDNRIDAYGNIDELNAHTGYLKDQKNIDDEGKRQLHWIQERLFVMGSVLASDPSFTSFKLEQITKENVLKIEQWIDQYDSELPPLKNFILPGGHPTISWIHICRTVCRRSERAIVLLINDDKNLSPLIIQFINRLSDYFFIFARIIGKRLGIDDNIWISRTT